MSQVHTHLYSWLLCFGYFPVNYFFCEAWHWYQNPTSHCRDWKFISCCWWSISDLQYTACDPWSVTDSNLLYWAVNASVYAERYFAKYVRQAAGWIQKGNLQLQVCVPSSQHLIQCDVTFPGRKSNTTWCSHLIK